MPITIRQIAQESGLSIQTVSQILNNKEGVYREETRQRVRSAAEHLGYRRNSSAQAMRRGRFGCVALVLSSETMRSLIPDQLLQYLYDRLAEHDLHLNFVTIRENDLTDPAHTPKILREAMVDGLLINYNSEIPESLATWIDRYKMPAVWLNSKHTSDCVFPDDFGSAREATARLIEVGHRRIAYIQNTESLHYSTVDRRAGYEAAMTAAGLTPQTVGASSSFLDSGVIERDFSWLQGEDRPTAVVCYNRHLAISFTMAVMSLHLRIPADLSVCTFNDAPLCMAGRTFSTIVLPEDRIASAAVSMLVSKIEDNALRYPPLSILAALGAGDTIGHPPVRGQ